MAANKKIGERYRFQLAFLWRGRFALILGGLLIAASGRAADIKWDDWGVPHIQGQSLDDAVRAFGWAQMRAHANVLLELVIHDRGEGALYLGAGQDDAEIKSDSWVRTMRLSETAGKWLDAQTSEERSIIANFVDGLNSYAVAHPQDIDPKFKVVLPVTDRDIVARMANLSLYIMAVNSGEAYAQVAAWKRGDPWAKLKPAAVAGSNGWAIAPSRSADGNSMLLINPHLPWAAPERFFEADLRYGDEHIYGATFIGFPFIAIGFNDHLGWTHTFNPMHSFYFYQLKLTKDGYLWDGKPHPFDTAHEEMSVRGMGGHWNRMKALDTKWSVHGPVLAEDGDRALALWVTGRDAPHMIGQYWAMAQAHDFSSFKNAAEQEQVPVFSIIYADRDGHIFYNFGGRNPSGPAETVRIDNVLDGSVSSTLWTGTISLDSLPQLFDPPTGWIQNANDPPWTTTWPQMLEEKNFPKGLVHPGADYTSLRAQQIIKMLRGDKKLSLEDLVAMKLSTHVEYADRVLDDLIAAGRHSNDPDARDAAEVLSRWDRALDPGSKGAGLFLAWSLLAGGERGMYQEPYDPAHPIETPRGLYDTALAGHRLARAARIMKEIDGRLDAPWSEKHRMTRDEKGLPANGGPDPFGVPRATNYELDLDHGVYVAVGGDSFVAAVNFGTPLRAVGLLSYGNFSQPALKGVRDQQPLYSEKHLRQLFFDKTVPAERVVLNENLPALLPERSTATKAATGR